jgi:hypothetical protein
MIKNNILIFIMKSKNNMKIITILSKYNKCFKTKTIVPIHLQYNLQIWKKI